MNKNDYLSEAAKYFLSGTLLLTVSKLFTILTAIDRSPLERFSRFGNTVTNFAFYGFLVLAFIALNGEKISFKRQRNLKCKKKVSRLKWLIAYNILFVFFKKALDRTAFSYEPGTDAAAFTAIITGLLSACASMSFFLFVISLWYFVRDRKLKELFPVQTVTVIISAVYFAFKLSAAVLVDYRLGAPGSALYAVLKSSVFSNTLCLVQYTADIIMFISVKRRYSLLSALEDEAAADRTAGIIRTVSIYDERGFGIDDSDELLLPVTVPSESCAAEYEETDK